MVKRSQPDNKEFKRVLLYYETFSTESGMAVLKDLRNQYNVQSYVPGDSHATAFCEGRRSVVAEILSILHLSKHPEKFKESLDEYEE